ncbi:MAG: cadmium-translocating P-type ATPase [Lachnospiraceae bacterium]|nr:cadmium-translocating P-type ATPase [Lachnospiraceae bacterium]
MSHKHNEEPCCCGYHDEHEYIEHNHEHKHNHKHEVDECCCGENAEEEEEHCHDDHCSCHEQGKHEEHCHDDHCHCHDDHEHEKHHHHDNCGCDDDDDDDCGCGCGCGCGHDHEHGGSIEKSEIAKIFLAAAILIAAIFVGEYAKNLADMINISLGTVETVSLVLYLIAYFTVGGEVVRTAVKNICKGKVFDENFLMGIATVGAFFIGEYPEAVAVMMFYQIGEMFQSYAVGKSRKSITSLMDIRPDVAYVKLHDGSVVKREPKDVRIGEIIVVKPGEKVALDGKLAKGEGTVDTMALTGESLPREVEAGDKIISGSISVNGVLEIEVEKEFGQSTVSKILEMVENASSKKAESEKFISKFARYYTPIVVYLALALAIIPPLFIGISDGNVWSDWIYRALNFLVISCPCALVISVPLSFFGGLGGASSQGILIKGSNYIEALAKCDTLVFDKTGTLTKGNFKVTKVNPVEGVSEGELLKNAATAEQFSNHPIALSIIRELREKDIAAYDSIRAKADATGYEEISGHGIKALKDSFTIYAGSSRLMDKFDISYTPCDALGTIVYIAVEDNASGIKYIGSIVIEDEIKEDATEAISGLAGIGVSKTVMLTGDKENIAEHVAGKLGVSEVHGELLPADKVSWVEKLLEGKKQGTKLAFVGDGINDAPVLARADIGIAMGGMGQDAAIEAADVVLMDDKPSNIVKAIKIARKTLGIVKQNIVFAIAVKVGVLVLAAIGIASMWYAVFADVGVCVIAILNALRAMRYK